MFSVCLRKSQFTWPQQPQGSLVAREPSGFQFSFVPELIVINHPNPGERIIRLFFLVKGWLWWKCSLARRCAPVDTAALQGTVVSIVVL